MPPKKKSSTPVKKPTARKTATKKPTTTPKAKAENTTKSSGKTTATTPKKRKTTPKPKRKTLPPEEMHPFTAFPYRLEYQDGTDTRVCHFECEEHRTKHIQRYKLRKGSYFIDTLA